MAITEVDVVETTVQKTHLWLKELMEELGWQDRPKAFLALRAVLHTLRDRLTVEEAAQLGAQLPMLIRGLYYEGWDPSRNPVKMRHKEEFLFQIREHFVRNDPRVDPEWVARGVFKMLNRRISEGELSDVKGMLPEEIRDLWS